VQYLEPGSKRALIATIEQRLLAPHVSALLEKGFDALMDAMPPRSVLGRCVVGGGSGLGV
jgi:hypothetical protein